VWEVGVSDNLASFVILALVFRAGETVFGFFLSFNASLAVCIFWPHASSGVFVEVKSSGTLVFDVFTVNASVEDFAYCGVWMGEETVLSWAVVVLSLGCFC
jgi:hypothetical protein